MEIRPLADEKLRPVGDVWNEAIQAQEEGYRKHTLDVDRLVAFTESERFTPDAALVAVGSDGPVGLCVGYLAENETVGRLAGIAVHPDSQGEGVGRRLLAGVEDGLVDAGATEMRYHINRQSVQFANVYLDTGPYRFLVRAGYRPLDHAVRLRNNLTGFELPEEIVRRRAALADQGIIFRRATDADREALLAFMAEHFSGGWQEAIERATRDLTDTAVVIAEDGAEIIGFHGPHEVDQETGRARFGMPGVQPGYRGQGIGKALIYLGLDNLAGMGANFTEYRTGYQRAGLSASTEIYWDTGARLVEVIVKAFEKPLVGGTPR